MAFLGRPSSGDSPFAIGDKAMRDTSSPQPPHQRYPTPRRSPGQIDPNGFMTTPSPYGSVSDEGRKRYEERYARKKAEEEAAAAARQGPPAQQPPPQQYGGPQHPQQLQPGPPRQQYSAQAQPIQRSPQPQQRSPQPQPFSPNPQSHPDPRHSMPPPGGHPSQPQQQPQQPYGNREPYVGRPGSLPRPPAGYTSPPPQNQQPAQRQRWSNPPQPVGGQGPQWSAAAPPPPSQQWQPPRSPTLQQAEDAELHALFGQFDSSRSGQLNSYDLQRLLAKDATMEAREDAVKMLMNIFDTDRSGSINFMEFEGLYRYIQDWHGIFLRFDRDSSGLIDRKELHQALLGFGFSLPSDMVRKLEKRFAPPPKPGQRAEKGISFDRFLMACVTVKHFTEAFRRADTRGEGRLTLDYNQFMEMVLEAPA